MSKAIENQREHDAKRRRCEREGRQPDQPATFRQEFCAHGANPTVDQRREKTAFSTRRSEITQRSQRALEKMDSDTTNELSRQLRDNFEIQATRTTTLVQQLYTQFADKLKETHNTTPLNRSLAGNEAFVRDLVRIKGVEDYVKMVKTHGIEYALTAKQIEELGNLLKLKRGKWRLAAVAAGKVMEELESLWARSQKN